MKIAIVADSSANTHIFDDMEVTYVPLKIVTEKNEYVDDDNLDVSAMLSELREYKGKSSTACPCVNDWLDAFGDADMVLGCAITSNLSGCYNSARLAVEEYMEANPGKKVFILDTLSTGPEMQLILEKYRELILKGKSFEEIVEEVKAYSEKTHLIFALTSLDNFAKNGRVNPALAKAVGILGIRIVGKASDEGTLEPMHKCRGEKRALRQLVASMKELGYSGGKVRISHSYNPEVAGNFTALLKEEFPDCEVHVCLNRGLCCYYAEEGGMLIGFEG